MLCPISVYSGLRYVLRVAKRLCAAGANVGAPATAQATIAGVIFGTGAWMPCGVVRLAALLNEQINYLLVGRRLLKGERR